MMKLSGGSCTLRCCDGTMTAMAIDPNIPGHRPLILINILKKILILIFSIFFL